MSKEALLVSFDVSRLPPLPRDGVGADGEGRGQKLITPVVLISSSSVIYSSLLLFWIGGTFQNSVFSSLIIWVALPMIFLFLVMCFAFFFYSGFFSCFYII